MSISQKPKLFKLSTVLEESLPSYLLVLGFKDLPKIGFEVPDGLVQALEVESVKPLFDYKFSTSTIQIQVMKIENVANKLRAAFADPESPRANLIAVARWVLQMNELQMLPDAARQALLVSAQIVQEASDNQDDWGLPSRSDKPLDLLWKAVKLENIYGASTSVN